jgi:long-subunit fatty acid transport protein
LIPRARLLLFCALALVARPLSASNPRASGLAGARASALAGAVTADADDCSAAYYNPANLAAGDRSWLCLDYSAQLAELRPGGRSSAESSLHTVGGGVVARGQLFEVPFGVGATLTLPSAKLSRIESIAAEDESWVLDTNRPRVSFGSIGIGLTPLPALSLGIALHVLAGVRGQFAVNGELAQPDADDSRLRHAVDADLASARSFAAGATLRASQSARVALVYRHRARVVQKIDGQLDGTIGAPPLSIPAQYRLGSTVTPAAYPSVLSLSTRLELAPRLALSAELAWENFGDWPAPDGTSESSLTLGDFPADLGDGERKAARPEPHDRLVPRLGGEYTALLPGSELRLRAGYSFERSPLPVQRTTRWLDADRHGFSAGAGIEIEAGSGVLRADAYGLLTLLPERGAVQSSELGPARRASGIRYGFGLGTAYGF